MTRDKLLVAILFVVLGSSVAAFIIGVSQVVGKPYEIILGEGFAWMQADMLARGETLFSPVSATQLLIIPHTPLYVIVCSWFTFLFGSSLAVGRAVALGCGVGILGLVYLITNQITKNWVVSLVAALLVVSTYTFRFLAPMYRMDTMGVMWCLLGMYLFLKFEGRGKLVYLSIPACILAFYTKQNYILVPVAVCIYLVVRNWRDFRPALKYGGVFLAGLLGSLVVAGLMTDWQLLVHNLGYLGLGSTFTWHAFLGGLQQLAFHHMPLVIVILGYYGYRLWKKTPVSLLDTYGLVALVVLLAMVGKVGGSFHYGFEIMTLGCIMVGVLLQKALKVFEGSPSMRRTLLAGAVWVLIVLQVVGMPLGVGLIQYKHNERAEAGTARIVEYLKDTTGPVFTDGFAVTMLAGDDVVWDKWEPSLLFRGNLQDKEGGWGWDQTELVRRFETGHYQSVVLFYDLIGIWNGQYGTQYVTWLWAEKLSPEVAKAIIDNYDFKFVEKKLGSNFQPYNIYVYERKEGN